MRKLILLTTLIVTLSCNDKPKVIQSVTHDGQKPSNSTGIFDNNNNASDAIIPVEKSVHHVMVKEVLPTEKYVYLYVEEEGEEDYWIATGKKEVQVGEKYYYKNGLLKTNFESKEHNRVFDKVYLVGNLVSENHGQENHDGSPTANDKMVQPIKEIKGAIQIADIVNSPKKYDGQKVLVSGVCSKLNPGIMNRNWIHIKDGSMDDYDMVITSDIAVPAGHQVVMEGVVSLNKDFGAGYKYAIIIENGTLVN